ncbi:nitroreductase family protein [Maricurvus nonylphenolicus]|uniref:nitroreductase family protein n=1 Tax=Maricurvus nonylphenolicus TaxID=1008307 RepID=UPI0036F2354A
MNIFDAIEQRRSVKHYDPAASMPEQDFEKLMSAMLLSPTSFNAQHWRVVRVQDKALRAKIQQAAFDQAQVSDAAELIVLCADINAWQDRPVRYWANVDESVRNVMLPMMKGFYEGKEQLQRDEALRSCGIAAQTLMLAAKGLGYDSNPLIGFDAEQVAELVNLPEGHLVSMLIAVGKAQQPARPRGGQLPLEEIVVNNTFS